MLHHKGTQPLTTPRLHIRPYTLADAPAMFANWASDPQVTKYLTWPTHTSEDVSRFVLNDWVSHYSEPNYYNWAITLPGESDAPIGNISVVHQDENIDSVQIGYCLGRAWWHRGIMTEALQAVIAYMMDEVGANRVEARHDPRNPHSGDVMRKCGMVYEGTTRQSDRNNQGVCDTCWYAILQSDRTK